MKTKQDLISLVSQIEFNEKGWAVNLQYFDAWHAHDWADIKYLDTLVFFDDICDFRIKPEGEKYIPNFNSELHYD